MKKTIFVFALVVSVMLCLALASCKPKVPEHEHEWDAGTVVKEGTCNKDTQEETKGEKLYTCTICGTTKTEEIDGHAWDEGENIAAPTCVASGSRLYKCGRCKATKTEELPLNPDAHERMETISRIVLPPTATKSGETERICIKCGKGVTTPMKFADYNPKVLAIKSKAQSFSNADFGTGSIRSDLGGSYAAPAANPKEGQHPRVLFTSSAIDGINAELHDMRGSTASRLFRKAVANPTDGALAKTAFDDTDKEIFRNIQALALDYAVTKNEISGYSAIYALKNALKTMTDSWTGHDDVAHRYYGYAMYIAACVYDWCYDLMDKTDRDQIVLGVQEKICKVGMTVTYAVGFPPTSADAVSGHGTSFMILRDYLAFAIAIYDEYPGWWKMIAGRFYEEYVPVRNEIYKAQMAPQGVSLYVRSKFIPELYSAWLVKTATGKFPYASEENMKQIARTVYSYELPGRYNQTHGVGFNGGDDHVPDGSFIDYGHIALYSSYIFNDATMRAQLEYDYHGMNGCSYTDFSGDVTATATVSEYLICSSSGLKAASDRREGMPLIRYNGGWLGQIIARSSWDNDQAAVLMKIGQRTLANHDHYDAGQFQIFYKNVLAGDTGAYIKYHETHHSYYHQATIAHNSLLIYNPSLSSTDGGYYSGGQKRLGDANMSNWKTDTFKTGEVTGVSYGYADAAQTTPTYAYIAGDIAAAYDSSVASEVTRRMLVVFDTKNPNVPMYFFVFDNVKAKNGSFKKTFLLHTAGEPTVNQTAKTVTETVGDGKLVLQNVIGNNVTITAIGGYADAEGKNGRNYLVNGKQLDNQNYRDDEYWGRVEISPATGNATDQLLNVMYVCDADKTLSLPAAAIDTAVVKGARIGKVAAVFVTEKTRRTTEFQFASGGSGTLDYYVSGVRAGTWAVKVDGVAVTTVQATSDGGFVTFTAPAGNVTLTPQ